MCDTFKKGEWITVLRRCLPLLFFTQSIILLYSLYPESFEATWKGRYFYIFFLWLFFLEIITGWDRFQENRGCKLGAARTISYMLALIFPMIYVLSSSYGGLNAFIADLAGQNAIYWAEWMPLSIEYLVFSLLLSITILIEHGGRGFSLFPISISFLTIVGVIYTIDNLYPFGRFTPFQFFVPMTATLASQVLRLTGHQTLLQCSVDGMPSLVAWNTHGRASYQIAWPCSGVESLCIYTVTTLLFLKNTSTPWRKAFFYFSIGALVTLLINVLRIANLFIITIKDGDWVSFHNFYGSFYSITWITLYPLLIFGVRMMGRKIADLKTDINAPERQ